MMKKALFFILLISLAGLIFWKREVFPQKTIFNEGHRSKLSETIPSNDKVLPASKETQSSSLNDTVFDHQLNSLPTLEDLKALTNEDVHHTPEIIKNGAETVGRVHSEAEADSTKRKSALQFFKSCAEDDMIATAIRAVCLKKIYTLIPKWGIPVILSENKISKEVSDLAMKLPKQ